ncbi:DUF3949 domain-containing protein [Bacillus cereus]|uniref:DUF3949 domain-containing protein n=1 Tax=Bacillus cereus TaxID=1396 RepID=UPI0026BA48F1
MKKMSFGEEQLHFHVQGNPFNIPSAFVAYMILKVKGRKKHHNIDAFLRCFIDFSFFNC